MIRIEGLASAFVSLWLEMAPYLLLGFAAAGLLRLVLKPEWVARRLGGAGAGPILRASLFGVPLPLCSCGVIPVAAGLRRQGGSRGAVAAFTASTPQTGVDSIAATWALLGPLFAGVRVVVAFVSGALAGILVNLVSGKSASAAMSGGSAGKESGCCGGESPTPEAGHDCNRAEEGCGGQHGGGQEGCHGKGAAAVCGCPEETARGAKRLNVVEAVKFGFMDLPRDVARSLLLGMVLAAIITALVPEEAFGGWLGGGVWGYVAATVIGVPLYVCSTGSIPLAYAFLAAGLSPGATLVFLVTGPATNVATITALTGILGGRGVVAYLAAIVASGWGAGGLLDLSGATLAIRAVHEHGAGWGWFTVSCGVALAGLMVGALVPEGWLRRGRRAEPQEECPHCRAAADQAQGSAG